LALGQIEFEIPGIEGGATDFREIPLIIGVFYIRNPLFLIIGSLLTSIEFQYPYEGSAITTFVMHIIPTLITWWVYKKASQYFLTALTKGLLWVFFIIIYYSVFLIPIMIVSDAIMGVNTNEFMNSYFTIMGFMKFEMVATALITALYLVQFETRKNLLDHKKDLEKIVLNRTEELALANKTLIHLNENLDDMVQHRSAKVEKQLNMLVKYAHMNSHEVRAPLARMLGLIYIIEQEDDADDKSELRRQLSESALELDEVVKSMNRLLEKEIFGKGK